MQITAHIAQVLCSALAWPAERRAQIEAALATPPNLALGDCAFPCFQLAKELRTAPNRIAQDLAGKIQPDRLIASAVAEGPYLNLFLNRRNALGQVLGEIRESPSTYGHTDMGRGQTLVLDFSAPNIAKPFHFGHLRSTNIGADLARIFAFQGWEVLRKNYLGDWGTQFGFVIYAWQKWGDEAALEARAIDYLVELYIRANRESEQDPSVREQARSLFLRLEQGDAEIRALWSRFRALSLDGFMRTYARLGISFDSYDGESSINDKVQSVVDRFLKAGVAKESLGAIVVEVADVLGRDIAPCMLQKSDGASTYAARDCAEAIDRWERYQFGANIYVVSRQEDHFAQVFAALGKLAVAEQWPVNWPARCENISFGYVRGMSTRKGEAVWLEAVLDEARDRAGRFRIERAEASARGAVAAGEADTVSEAVGQAALLYFDVSSRRMTDLSFDWDAVLQFEGNTGPYLQYAYARMSGIFRKAAELGLATADEPGDLATLGADEEWLLVQKLRGYGPAVRRAAEQREPFEVAHYLYELASVFNAFYNRHVVIEVAEPVRSRARLTLVKATQSVMRSGLQLLGIRPLEQM
ncbi:MAG: arginine--tRNA ligase [Gammaproteobacteria bacterium]|jgi:arginyl-tRNA synthetase|nr:arginine--tRNA ligase [Gammaproteobacteria bacterium]